MFKKVFGILKMKPLVNGEELFYNPSIMGG